MEFPGGVSACCDLAYGAPNRESLTVNGSTASILLREPNMAPHTTKRNQLSLATRIEDYAWLGYRALFPRHRMLRSTIAEVLGVFAETIRTGDQFRAATSDACTNIRAAGARIRAVGCHRCLPGCQWVRRKERYPVRWQ